MLDRYAVFTKHAHDRLNECQISVSKAAWLLYYAEQEKLPRDLRNAKDKRYSETALHLRNGTYLFTLIPTVDKFTGDEIYLVLSVFDQRMDVRSYGRKKRGH